MTVDRILPTDEAHDLLDLTRELADGELAPRVADFEARGEFPREVIRTLGRAGLLGLPYPEDVRRRRPAVRGLPAGPGDPGRRAGWPSPRRSACTRWPASRSPRYGSDEQRKTAARHARRRAARRLLPVRAAGRLRRRRR